MEYKLFRDSDLSAFAEGAKIWRDYATHLYDFQDRIATQVLSRTRASGWAGEAADTNETTALSLREWCETRAMRADAMADLLEQVHERLVPMRADLQTIVDGAVGQGLVVGDDGTVLAPGAVPVQPDIAGPYTVAADLAYQYTTAIAGLLSQVEQLSASATSAVNDLAPEMPGVVTDHEYNDIRDDAHEHALGSDASGAEHTPGTPQENADWWNGLSVSEQNAYMLTYPESVGAMDGLPTITRDRANRWNLERDIEVGYDRENAQKLLAKIESHDDLPPGQRLYLIGYQGPGPNGSPDAKVIASVGNPDTAANTSVLVPGTTTNLESCSGEDMNRAIRLQAAANALTPGAEGDAAVVLWLGYDAPDNIADAANPDYAKQGAPDLVDFVNGLSTSHGEGTPSHTTVIGHSYGATLVGHADSGDNFLMSDDVVALGSPGMGVDSVGQMHTVDDHVWAGAFWNDAVQNAPGHGPDPTDTSFGANTIMTDYPGQPMDPIEVHSHYWDDNSESLKNQARIMMGMYDKVIWEGPSPVGLLDPFGIKD